MIESQGKVSEIKDDPITPAKHHLEEPVKRLPSILKNPPTKRHVRFNSEDGAVAETTRPLFSPDSVSAPLDSFVHYSQNNSEETSSEKPKPQSSKKKKYTLKRRESKRLRKQKQAQKEKLSKTVTSISEEDFAENSLRGDDEDSDYNPKSSKS